MTEKPLLGCRILIVEDDFYQARDIQRLLENAGAEVLTTGSPTPDLDHLMAQGKFDGGLLDINLGQGITFAFARTLRDHAIPFVFLTGYHPSSLPTEFLDAPCLRKPATTRRIVEELSIIAAGAT